MPPQCTSIKSKKFSHLRCANQAKGTDGFCAKHCKTRIAWTDKAPSTLITPVTPRTVPLTRKHRSALEKIKRLWIRWRTSARRSHGPALFVPSLSNNSTDIYTMDPVESIPFTYHFSYFDLSGRIWTFDLRFLLHLLQYGNLKNPYTQEAIPERVLERLETRSKILRTKGLPIVYLEDNTLTPDQIWNQKVMDVFLKITSLGYGVNMIWFESMVIHQHQSFYRKIYNLWDFELRLSKAEKDTIVPGHMSGRTILFKWTPAQTLGEAHDIRWWRKHNLALMNAFFVRGQDRATQGCGALYILTAMASCHPRVAEAFPWLVA